MPLPATAILDRPADDLPLLSAGRLVFDRYRLEKIAGRGGMGIVWRALDSKLERKVALKFLPDLYFLDHAARDDLKRETRRSLELTHPSIVRIYDFLEDDHMAAISMEYIDGATLSQRRVERPERFFETPDLEAWTLTLCQTLDYAHNSAYCVHRDLKPGNLMITAREALKIADFGIACGLQNTAARVSAFTSSGGTMGYMSPQQLTGELASPSDDIYSLGATLYELLTSKPPFYSGDLALQIREKAPDGLSARRVKLGLDGAAIDPCWEETILACLAKDPEQRPTEVLEILQRLGLSSVKTTVSVPVDLRAPAPKRDGQHTPSEIPAPPIIRVASRRKMTPAIALPFRIPSVVDWAKRNGRVLAVAAVVLAGIAVWQRPRTPIRMAASSMQPVALAPATPVDSSRSSAEAPILPLPGPVASNTLVSISAPEVPPPLTPLSVPVEVQAADSLALANEVAHASAAVKVVAAKLQISTTPPGIPFRILRGAYESSGTSAPLTGISPALVEDLTPGAYRVEFAADGIGERSFSVRLAPGVTMPLEQNFPYGKVKIQSQPAGAEIFCDDVSIGLAPMEAAVLPGPHTFRAENDDDVSRPRALTVRENSQQNLAFDFRDNSKTTGAVHRTRPRRKMPEPSMLAKVGKSITTFFNGGNEKKR